MTTTTTATVITFDHHTLEFTTPEAAYCAACILSKQPSPPPLSSTFIDAPHVEAARVLFQKKLVTRDFAQRVVDLAINQQQRKQLQLVDAEISEPQIPLQEMVLLLIETIVRSGLRGVHLQEAIRANWIPYQSPKARDAAIAAFESILECSPSSHRVLEFAASYYKAFTVDNRYLEASEISDPKSRFNRALKLAILVSKRVEFEELTAGTG